MGVFTWGGYEPKEENTVCKEETACKTPSMNAREKQDMEEANKKINAEFYAIEQEEELERQKLRNYESGITVKRFPAGDFLCIGKHEIPRKFIESISVKAAGSPPYKQERDSEYYRYMEKHRNDTSKFSMDHYKTMASYHEGIACKGQEAQILIKMASGAEIELRCHRLAVDLFFDALNTAWKHTKAQ